MRRDARLSVALHVLLHMEETEQAITSESIGGRMAANPVVVRRTMAGLRDAGIVRSEKGHGGGWSLSRELSAVSLADVYEALGEPALFSIGHREQNPKCLVEQAVNRAVGGALADAEAQLIARFRGVTVADVSADVRRQPAWHAWKSKSAKRAVKGESGAAGRARKSKRKRLTHV